MNTGRIKLPREAMVLAAGQGSRLRAFGRVTPKPLTPLWNRPLIRRTLETLRSWNVSRVAINLQTGADDIFRELRERPVPGLSLDFSFEPERLGTGGALRRAAWFFGDSPFWIVNSDIAFDLDPLPLVRALRDPRTLASLWMHPLAGPRTVDVKDGRAVRFQSAQPGGPGTLTFCGLQLVRPEIFRFVPPAERPCSLVEIYEAAMADRFRISAVCVPRAAWADIGTPERLLAAHAETAGTAEARAHIRKLRRAGIRVRRWAAVDPAARVATGVVLEAAVVSAGASVPRSACVTDAWIGPNAIVRSDVRGGALPFAAMATPPELRAARRIGLSAGRATAIGFDARGSAREFIRVEDGRQRAMLIRYRRERAENVRYASHANRLQRLGLAVPRILEDGDSFLFMEDLGDQSVQTAWPQMSDAARFRLYLRIIRDVERFHAAGRAFRNRPDALEPQFDLRLFASERGSFIDRFLSGWAGRASEAAAVDREMERVARRLVREPRVLVHRDLQSSNILLARRGPVFIDFQGMRMGPAAYDWAALLYDPYIPMSRPFRERLVRAIRCSQGARRTALTDAAIQRLTQALGAYARLATGPNGRIFVQTIPRALEHLDLALSESELPFPRLHAFVRAQLNLLFGTGYHFAERHHPDR